MVEFTRSKAFVDIGGNEMFPPFLLLTLKDEVDNDGTMMKGG